MRILYLTSGFPYPLTSGYLRHYHFIRELGDRHEITLASLVNHRYEPEHAGALAPFTREVLTFPADPAARRRGGRLLRGLRTLTAGERAARQMQRALSRLLTRRAFDVALFSGKHTLPALRALGGLPLVADICDAASVRYRGRMQHSGPLGRLQCLAAAVYMRRAERKIIRSAAHVLFASSRDRDALLPPHDERATVVPNGVDLDFWSRRNRERGRTAIVFTGAMSYPPNADAALFLIQHVFPQVRQAVPEAEVWIVGRDPGPRLVKAGQEPGVTVTGFVDDVRPWLERASVFAAPLRFGAGIQNKLLEAMAMELPIVASSLAADGLRTDGGLSPPLTVADDAQQASAQIVRQLQASRIDPVPDERARRYVAEHFVWSRSGARLEEVLQSVADNDPPNGRNGGTSCCHVPDRDRVAQTTGGDS